MHNHNNIKSVLDGRTLKRKGAKDGEMEDGEGKAGGWSLGREYRGKEGCPKGRMNRREGELQEEGGRVGGKRRGEGNGWMGRMGEQKGRPFGSVKGRNTGGKGE